MKTNAMIVLEELNKPASSEFKKALRKVVMDLANQANEKLSMIQALNFYMEAIKKSYLHSEPVYPSTDTRNKLYVKFCNGLSYKMGSMYIKVISGSSVHSFIVREDGPKFKKGDILKAATWKAPALNQARGNIFGEYHTNWTGADYLR